jgi:exodeoxyribonuclease VII large subunit
VKQFSLFGLESQIWTVADLTRYIRQSLESDYRLGDIWVSGEVSNVSRPASGHLYFTLKDEHASLRCVMWRSEVSAQTYLPQDGDSIEVHGHISVYEAGGQYQLYADELQKAGEGALYQRFLRLKAKLESEGLFEATRKRELPLWPERLGIVTSPTGAALQDVLNVLRRRFPLTTVILAPTPVQGDEAPAGIVDALQALNQYGHVDVILLVRGGGSIEDLWAFNDEGVAHAIAASQVPVVAGIGHASDLVIADLVADVHAPTPSAAAEMATPDRQSLAQALQDLLLELGQVFSERLLDLRSKLSNLTRALQLASPRAKIDGARQRVDELSARALAAMRYTLALRQSAVKGAVNTLRAVGPESVLSRGYAIVRRVADDKVVRSTHQVDVGDALNLSLHDGTIDVTTDHVESTSKDEE